MVAPVADVMLLAESSPVPLLPPPLSGPHAAAIHATTITGPLLASLLLGIADVAGKYYIPKMGGFIVYGLMIAILLWKPHGLFVRQGGKA